MNVQFPVELQNQIEQAILTGDFAVGQTVEVGSLAVRFHVSPQAILLVLLAEHRKGLVAQQAAAGFTILGYGTPSIDSVFQHTSKAGLKPTSEMRGTQIEPATVDVATRLKVALGAPVYRLDRTRLVNGQVLANQTNVIPFEVCAGLEHDDVSHASFQQLIENKYHAITAEMQEEFAMTQATDADASVLGLPVGTPILAIERLASSITAMPLILTKIHVRPDRFQYIAALWPSAQRLLEQHGLNT